MEIKQDTGSELVLVQDKKTIDWLVNYTMVSVFNPIKFEGYQRQINEDHCANIVKYLNQDGFILPTAIICATNEKYEVESNNKLRVVDGQHRIKAFEILKEKNAKRY